MQGQAAGGNLPGFLKDPKVQIGLIVGAVVILIAVVCFVLFGNRGGGTVEVGLSPDAGMNGPAGMEASDPNAPVSDIPGGAAPGSIDGTMGQPTAAPAPGQQAQEKPAKGLSKVEPSRQNPFKPNTDMQAVIDSIPEVDTSVNSLPHGLYNELHTPKPEVVNEGEEEGGPPVPAMRVAGVMMGSQVSAVMQMGTDTFQVTPGKMIPEGNPVYRVERIEQDKVFLTRKWAMGGRKGTQKIEVSLAGTGAAYQMAAAGGGGYGAAGGSGMMGGGAGMMGGSGMMGRSPR